MDIPALFELMVRATRVRCGSWHVSGEVGDVVTEVSSDLNTVISTSETWTFPAHTLRSAVESTKQTWMCMCVRVCAFV